MSNGGGLTDKETGDRLTGEGRRSWTRTGIRNTKPGGQNKENEPTRMRGTKAGETRRTGKAEKRRSMEGRMDAWEGGQSWRRSREMRLKTREPALKGLSPPWQEIKGKKPQVGFQELSPLPGDSFQRHPWISLTPRSCRRRRGICKRPPCSIKWEHLLAPLGPGAQSTPLPLPPSSSLLTPHYHPLPCPGQGGAQVKLKVGRGPGTFCSFLHHWLPGQECVMSPVVVTGLQECGHQEAAPRGARQGTWAQT